VRDAGGLGNTQEKLQINEFETHMRRLPAFGDDEGTIPDCRIATLTRPRHVRGMPPTCHEILGVTVSFILAGAVKGLTGMGLPTVAMGLLGLVMQPAQAAACLIVPSAVTNLWQFLTGPHRLWLVRRLWSMLVMVCVATWAAAGLIAGGGAGYASIALGAALVIHALVGLAKVQLSVPPRHETWLAPLTGAATGLVTGATGVFVIPAVPYVQALGLDKDHLVQALGLSFSVSTFALAAGLASRGAFHPEAIGVSTICTLPALVGMAMGQAVRARANTATFRLLFLIGLLVLGTDLIVRSLASGPVTALENERRSTAQARDIAVTRRYDLRRGASNGELSYGLVENRTIAMPGGSHVAGDVDDAGRESCDDETQPVADLISLFFQRLRRV
jgi:uncharacterized membrane protein YfcA